MVSSPPVLSLEEDDEEEEFADEDAEEAGLELASDWSSGIYTRPPRQEC
jgi:hypothetical protein